ncbi:type IV pilin protein [Dyella acidiphila]|uniref:Prepilin-type N-terminal cleavage/methylation domain-containing protein n=1 Tax=Dyella acidiphila TaxID=2775866 RepID=A0ABR9GCU7_9GAMM|nr:type IV pilin protein [Dyella acidiphila]MBE1161864.1 prepilin-type N-terminal cleavage/methylation domain-containing protein [Dyella acidiphila]
MHRHAGGFTLIELMTVVVIIAVLAAIAISTYGSYITRSKIQSAKSDLSALALNLENEFQRELQYSAHATSSTAQTQAAYQGWRPAEGKDFVYTVASASTTYTLTATGIDGPLASCVLTLPSANVQQRIDPNTIGSVSGCGSVTTW